MKTNSAFKLKSGNKPSMAKLSGVMKNSPAKQTFTHSTSVPKGTKTRADGKLSKPKLADPVSKPKKKVTFAEAYKKRDMKTYGNLNLKEYTAEAKRQIANKKATAKPSRVKKPTEMAADAEKNRGTGKGSGGYMTKAKEGSYDAPKSQMKGSLKPSDKTKTTKTTKTKKTTLLPDPKNFETVKSAKAKRKSAKKAVRTARKEFGRGSAEVKAAKTKRKEAKAKVRSTKKRDKAASGKRSTIGKIGYFLAGPAGRAKMDAKKAAKTKTVKKEKK